MKTTLNLAPELMTGIDVMNTLNGGVSEVNLTMEHFDSHRQITLRVPGVSIENINVQINNHQLMIVSYKTIVSQDKPIQFPQVLYNKSIPYFVDADNITADLREDHIVVHLPFNELSNGYQRDIPIQ